MKISSIKKLILEEFPVEIKPWLDKLFQPLNKALSQTNQALSGQLTIGDNVKGAVIRIGVVANTARFTWTINEKPNAIFVGSIIEDSAAPGTIPTYSIGTWTIDSSNQIIVPFSGLDVAKKYKVKIIGLV